MNYENMDLAIKLMEFVGEIEKKTQKRILNMGTYQDTVGKLTIKKRLTPTKAAHCGTVCCFSGWVAQCPAFRKQGVTVDPIDGAACYKDCSGSQAIADLLGIGYKDAFKLIYFMRTINGNPVKPKDVVKKLKELKAQYGD